MKTFVAVVFCALIASTFATELNVVRKDVGADLCPICMELMNEAIQELVNIIANVGVIGGCGDVCSHLPDKLLATACDLVCDYVGIEEFVKILQETDPDPVYICQLFKVCPIADNGAAQVTSFTVSPTSGPQGTTFTFDLEFTVTNQTGAGEIVIGVNPPGGEPFGTGSLNPGMAPGNYQGSFTIQAQPSEQEAFNPGNYPTIVEICNGECGATHPHTKMLASAQTQFTITQQ